MDWLLWILNHPQISAFVGFVLAAFAWQIMTRSIWNTVWERAGNKDILIPERCWNYDAYDLQQFAARARNVRIGEETALQFYIAHILKRSEILFAITLASITAYLCYIIAVSPMPYQVLSWIAVPCGAMALVYGAADVAEDLKLASILGHPEIDRAEATAANMLTRIKQVSLTLSVVGLAVFELVVSIELLVEKMQRKVLVARR
jgi:hypothetical protein